MPITLRPAVPGDAPFILDNIRGLAAVEGRPEVVTIPVDRIVEILFGEAPAARCVIIEQLGTAIGHAWFYTIVPTFTGTAVFYLEDLYIRPEHRSKGTGRAAMAHLSALALGEGCGSMAWTVVEGNVAAARFYERLGAEVKGGSVPYRLERDAMGELAREAAGA
jgi:GNAT superfamily N-acetyltransferase